MRIRIRIRVRIRARKRSKTKAGWLGNILLFVSSFVTILLFSLAIFCDTIFSPPPPPSSFSSPSRSISSASIFTLPLRLEWSYYAPYHQSSIFITSQYITTQHTYYIYHIYHIYHIYFLFHSIQSSFISSSCHPLQRLINNFHPYRSIFSSTNRSDICSINLFFL